MSAHVSIVVPAHDEHGCIPLLCLEIDEALDDRLDYEVLLVDDGSTDGTLDEMVAQAERRENVRCLRLPTRQGQSAALLAGIRGARGDVVVTMDADLQYSAEDVPRLVEGLTHADVVVGIRTERLDGAARRWTGKVGNAVRRAVLGDPFRDICCGLKAYRREWLKDLPPFDGVHRFLPAIVALRGARVRQIEVSHRARRNGASRYGVVGPSLRGLFDLAGVRWSLRRQIVPSAAQERRIPPAGTAPDQAETTELPRADFPRSEASTDPPPSDSSPSS